MLSFKTKKFHKNLTINDTKINKKSLIIKNLNDFFVNTGQNLGSINRNSIKTFQTFLPEANTVLNVTKLTEKKFLNSFQSLKNDKSLGIDELHVNVIKPVYNEKKAPLKQVFRDSVINGSFPEKINF